MNLIVPAGIGDWSWIWSKFYSVRDQIESVGIVDGAPRRTQEYVQACGIANAYYDELITGGSYQFILQFEHTNGINWRMKPTWDRVKNLGSQYVLIEANQHLEAGLPLSDWLPDLPTEYHYPLFVSEEDRERAWNVTGRAILGDSRNEGHPMKEGPIVGISCASYKGSKAWNTWGISEWVDFLTRVMKLGWRPLLVGAGFDDLTYAVACDLDLPSTVGKTSVPAMIEQMNILDAYIGFSSGMNVIRTVLDKPALAIWPCNEKCDQEKLSRSWAPPKMLESERYVAVTWNPVNDVWPVAKRFLRRCEQELAPKETGEGLTATALSTMLTKGYNGSGLRA